MSFSATFYNFSKRPDSTKQPSGGTQYQIILKHGCSIIRPTISLDIGQAGNPTGYNYCYIPEFNRYYFVSDWIFENRLWTASLKVDALATYKSYIGSSNQYILRCASAENQTVVDTLYPLVTTQAKDVKVLTTPFTSNIKEGTYIVGILGSSNSGIGATKYYALDNLSMRALCYSLLNTIDYMNIDYNEIGMSLARALVNPMQYIVSCIWVPFSVTGGAAEVIKVGWWETTTTGRPLTETDLVKTFSYGISDLPKHPSGKVYKYLKPYTSYYLDFPPFGYVELDPTDLVNTTNLAYDIQVDCITGIGTMRIQTVSGNNAAVLGMYTSQVGVPMALSAATESVLSAGFSLASMGVALKFGAIGAFALASGIGNVADSLVPKIQTVGSNGGIGLYAVAPRLTSIFQYTTAEDPTHNGYPYMQAGTIGNFSGYIKVDNAQIDAPATDSELSEITSYMNNGFYYE